MQEIECMVYRDRKILRYLDINASFEGTKHSISYPTMTLRTHREAVTYCRRLDCEGRFIEMVYIMMQQWHAGVASLDHRLEGLKAT